MGAKQATTKLSEPKERFTLHIGQRLREVLFITGIALSTYVFIILITYHSTDPAWSQTGISAQVRNAGGKIGALLADVLLFLLGNMSYIIPVLIAYGVAQIYRQKEIKDIHLNVIIVRTIGLLLFISGGCGLFSLHFPQLYHHISFYSGGIWGQTVGPALVPQLNFLGATIFLLTALLSGLTLFTGLSWLKLCDQTGALTLYSIDKAIRYGLPWLYQAKDRLLEHYQAKLEKRDQERLVIPQDQTVKPKQTFFKRAQRTAEPSDSADVEEATSTLKIAKFTDPVMPPAPQAATKTFKKKKAKRNTKPIDPIPPTSLLDQPERVKERGFSKERLEGMANEVENILQDYNVNAKVVAVYPGPVITRFELQLAAGVKVSKVSGLAKDLARSLSVISVRIVEVIPGKSVVGLEVPNEHREFVRLSEVLDTPSYSNTQNTLTLALGKDISGEPVVVDLQKMPHLLVAGTTGSGKSVGLNAMLLSLLYKCTPDQVRFVMIDPKMLELSIYDGIPHLLAPVVTDMKEAANALRWCVAEMERRYRLMASMGVRNLAGYNQRVTKAIENDEPLRNPFAPPDAEEDQTLEPLPYIVVVIDEFADMIMMVGKKTEELIARVAQKARAAGIHLILATQRPSVDVITGLIKANVPTRIAFQVSSRIDSRTILDQHGAEQLLGHGDMLYLPPGSGVPIRVHGAFVADHEVHEVVNYIKSTGEPDYVMEMLDEEGADNVLPQTGNLFEDQESDPLYDRAVQIVIETRKASISGVQRRLKIGYNRAARLLDAMEQAGLVSPMESNGSREVLIPES